MPACFFNRQGVSATGYEAATIQEKNTLFNLPCLKYTAGNEQAGAVIFLCFGLLGDFALLENCLKEKK